MLYSINDSLTCSNTVLHLLFSYRSFLIEITWWWWLFFNGHSDVLSFWLDGFYSQQQVELTGHRNALFCFVFILLGNL